MAKKKVIGEDGKTYTMKEKKPIYKRVWFWILAVIVVAGISGALGGEKEPVNGGEKVDQSSQAESKSEDKPETKESKKEEQPAEEVKAYNISDEVNVGDVMYVVNGIETATNVGGEYGQNSKGTYLIVSISVTNNGSEALSVSDDFFVLKNDGKEYKSDAMAAIYANDDSSFFLESINPDLTMSGKVIFDVSDAVIDSTTKQLQVATGFWGTETELINLQQ